MKRILKMITIVIISILLTLSIIFWFIPIDDWSIEKKLGNNYELVMMSGSYHPILYRTFNTTTKKYNEYHVIVENIEKCNFDDRWIITKSDRQHYWIIDKSVPINLNDSNTFESILEGNYYYLIVKAGLIGPLDSLTFFKELEEQKIKLRFSE